MTKLIYEEDSCKIRGAIFNVYKELGSGFLESVYQECLEIELEKQKIPFEAQKKLNIEYSGKHIKSTYIPDFICFDKIIIEIKAVETLLPIHKAQLMNYLKICKMKLGFLVNFTHVPKVKIERIIL